MTQSMSRVRHCIDNGPAGGFWEIVKSEMLYLHKDWSGEYLKSAIIKYIYEYNNTRLQERFGYRSPMEVSKAALENDNPEQ